MAGVPPQPADFVPSPCTRNCCLDDEQVCLGCSRHVQEIIEWSGANPARRLEIRRAAQERAAAAGAGRQGRS